MRKSHVRAGLDEPNVGCVADARQRAVVTSESIGFAYATRIRCYEVTVLYTRSGMWKVYRGDAYMFFVGVYPYIPSYSHFSGSRRGNHATARVNCTLSLT